MEDIDSNDGKTLFQEITDFEVCLGGNSTSTFLFSSFYLSRFPLWSHTFYFTIKWIKTILVPEVCVWIPPGDLGFMWAAGGVPRDTHPSGFIRDWPFSLIFVKLKSNTSSH